MPVMLSDTEAALFHALLLQIRADVKAIGLHEVQLATIAARLNPNPPDLPLASQASHQS